MAGATSSLQQYLPFTVLKLIGSYNSWLILSYLVATVLTVYGIETSMANTPGKVSIKDVATVLTVYGIETY